MPSQNLNGYIDIVCRPYSLGGPGQEVVVVHRTFSVKPLGGGNGNGGTKQIPYVTIAAAAGALLILVAASTKKPR